MVVSDPAHELRHQRAAHDGHDDERGGKFSLLAEAVNAEGKDGGEHDGHEEEAEKQGDQRDPTQFEDDDDHEDHVGGCIDREHLMRGDLIENPGTCETTKEE